MSRSSWTFRRIKVLALWPLGQFWLRSVMLVVTVCCLLGLSTKGLTYQQTMTCSPSGLYACLPGEEPIPIRWNRPCVVYYINSRGSSDFELGPDGEIGASLVEVVRRGYETWNDVDCSQPELSYGGLTQANDYEDPELTEVPTQNIVAWRNPWPSTFSSFTVAKAGVSYDPDTGIIDDVDILLNQEYYTFTANDLPEETLMDVQNTITHEVGHVLGLDHSFEPEATMYGSAPLQEIRKRDLHPDDRVGLCATYPSDDPPGTCGVDGRDKVPVRAPVVTEPEPSGCACDVTRPKAANTYKALFWGVVVWVGLRRRRLCRPT